MTDIVEFITSLPWYVYFILFIGYLAIIGKSKEWEYEAKLFRPNDNAIAGAFEIKKYKKEDPIAELIIKYDAELTNKELELVIDDNVIQTIKINRAGDQYDVIYPRIKTKSRDLAISKFRDFIKFTIFPEQHIKPQNNQKVEIRCHRETFYSGSLLKD